MNWMSIVAVAVLAPSAAHAVSLEASGQRFESGRMEGQTTPSKSNLARSKVVYPKGSSLGLAPPPAMHEARGFAGFMDEKSGSSIIVVEMPSAAFPEVMAGLDAGAALKQGTSFAGTALELNLAGMKRVRLYRGKQTTTRGEFAKWLLLAQTSDTTAMVTAQIPAGRAAELGGGVEAALRTLSVRTTPSVEDASAALPFTIGDRADFRLVRTLMGSTAQFTDGPLDIDPQGRQPLVIVAASLDKTPVPDVGAAARKLLMTLPGMTDTRITDERASPASSGWRIAALATSRGRQMSVVQHLLVSKAGGYVRTICAAPIVIDVVARCDRLAASVHAK